MDGNVSLALQFLAVLNMFHVFILIDGLLFLNGGNDFLLNTDNLGVLIDLGFNLSQVGIKLSRFLACIREGLLLFSEGFDGT